MRTFHWIPGWCRLAFLLLLLVGVRPVLALQGLTGVHDPSTIIKEGNTYWTFATGDGIYSLYSTDLVNWQPGPRAVFPNKAYPGWINGKVPGFQGTFWAPDCIYMNGKYYLYYSCSTFGSSVSAIGLVTNVTLDPTSPNYKWVDQGEVISTNAGSNVNAIDPALFKDSDGKVWFSYGSYWSGLRVLELDPSTGKPINGSSTTQFSVVNGDPEAAFLTKHGNYYYIFFNRGACCRGVSSTYVILVGRSTSPTGPFLDQNGVNLNQNGGTTVLASSGRYVGPGHAGLLEENGVTYFSHHYYDSYDNGAPKLGLAQLTWSATGWPSVSRNWVTPGRYSIKNQSSALVWNTLNCSGEAGKAVEQNVASGLNCQLWDLTALGNGDYKITSAQGGLTAGVANCAEEAGALLQLDAYKTQGCQQFHLDRAADGTFVWSALNGNRVIGVPGGASTAGTQLALANYTGAAAQRWVVATPDVSTASKAGQKLPGVSIFPVPAARTGFTLELGELCASTAVTVELFNLQGQAVVRQTLERPQARQQVATSLAPGLYLVRVRQGVRQFSQTLVVH
ncbi:family 43 glycosylhydrolase [Hymenobacter lutimineralis]|uniref:Family 43 glycosylhydrolase n=1 Tax=Hymenobacter lutimineralis TaxID=2606448 RepID=A0A5D6UVV8_9BACT|nr:family 43 glycosylhydrolase [Hymenobacter lutimineralis]TYZ06524.1 family 43 glycosylhydrolase [Hymenobacter lutimineralis]